MAAATGLARSAPIFDVSGRLCMALTLFGRTDRVDARPDGTLARIVLRTAEKVSSAFGYKV